MVLYDGKHNIGMPLEPCCQDVGEPIAATRRECFDTSREPRYEPQNLLLSRHFCTTFLFDILCGDEPINFPKPCRAEVGLLPAPARSLLAKIKNRVLAYDVSTTT